MPRRHINAAGYRPVSPRAPESWLHPLPEPLPTPTSTLRLSKTSGSARRRKRAARLLAESTIRDEGPEARHRGAERGTPRGGTRGVLNAPAASTQRNVRGQGTRLKTS